MVYPINLIKKIDCKSCLVSKMHCRPYTKTHDTSTSYSLDIIYVDVWGPAPRPSLSIPNISSMMLQNLIDISWCLINLRSKVFCYKYKALQTDIGVDQCTCTRSNPFKIWHYTLKIMPTCTPIDGCSWKAAQAWILKYDICSVFVYKHVVDSGLALINGHNCHMNFEVWHLLLQSLCIIEQIQSP